MESAYIRLLRIYYGMGYAVRIGLNPAHFGPGCGHVPYCYICRDGKLLSTGAGISLQEVFFFECLFGVYHPRNIFIVGNAFGWSTILMALCNPGARVVAIDSGVEQKDAMAGIHLTNAIIRGHKLNAAVVYATSPQHVAKAAELLAGPIDFAFIDGLHTNQQQEADFKAIQAIADPSCIYAFHDVVDWKMQESFGRIARRPNYVGRIMLRTPSGMGILYPKGTPKEVEEVALAFCHDTTCPVPAAPAWAKAPGAGRGEKKYVAMPPMWSVGMKEGES